MEADTETVARATRLRAALEQSGGNLTVLGTEPYWFAAARNGQRIPVGPAEEAELKAYLAATKTTGVASDDGYTAMMAEIDRFTVLRQMENEGITVMCARNASAAVLRQARDRVRRVQDEQTPEPPATP